ncbi:MAG: hypothetical protein QXP02_02085 [Desulfurococcaceae archaeon]
MPSEVLLPGVAVTLTLMFIASMLIGMLIYSTTLLFTSIRNNADTILRSRLNRVLITNAELTITGIDENIGVYRVDIVIYVHNDGLEPIYDMDKCDLMIQYYKVDGGVEVVRLIYGDNWYVDKIFLTDSYAVSFNSKNSIGPGETGVINGYFIVENIDVSRPVRVLFASHYGYTTSRWVSLGP